MYLLKTAAEKSYFDNKNISLGLVLVCNKMGPLKIFVRQKDLEPLPNWIFLRRSTFLMKSEFARAHIALRNLKGKRLGEQEYLWSCSQITSSFLTFRI